MYVHTYYEKTAYIFIVTTILKDTKCLIPKPHTRYESEAVPSTLRSNVSIRSTVMMSSHLLRGLPSGLFLEFPQENSM